MLDRLDVARGGRRVIADLSARLAPGRVIVVLGPNGAGKSSLLQAIAGLLPVSGAITLGGRMVVALPPRERGRLIGYLPQEQALHWNISVQQAVALGRLPHHHPYSNRVTDQAAVTAAMAQAAVAGLADRRTGTLSGGERARVLLARVLAGEPRWLLADEPLASLDPAHQIDMLDRLRALAGSGVGIVLVLHDLAHAARVADDVLMLKQGRLVGFGPASRWLTPATIGQLFGVVTAMHVQPDGRALPVVTGRLAE
ncbi:MAG: ABC transporter ATP-binding protein [Sphingomonas sp.]